MFGVDIDNTSGRKLLSSDYKSLVFIGKAVRASTLYMSEQASKKTKYYYSSAGLATTYPAASTPYGVFEVNISAQCQNMLLRYNCGEGLFNVTVGGITVTSSAQDSIAFVDYYVYAPSRPIVFIGSTSTVSGNVSSISDSGVVQPVTGFKKWIIKAMVGYQVGVRATIDNISLYCFSSCPNVATGYGIATYGSDGTVNYSSDYMPLLLSEKIVINSVSGGYTDSPAHLCYVIPNPLSIDYTADASLYTNPKPAFLAIDWLRATARHSYPYPYYTGYINSVCRAGPYYTIQLLMWFVGLGFRVNGSGVTAAGGIAAFDSTQIIAVGSQLPNKTTRSNGIVFDNIKTLSLPMTVPTINGSLYD
jgi:hypothetical protein